MLESKFYLILKDLKDSENNKLLHKIQKKSG